jgi:hypothetical protein
MEHGSEDARVTEEDFAKASARSTVSSKVAEAVAEILSGHACFTAVSRARAQNHGRRGAHAKRAYRPRDHHHHVQPGAAHAKRTALGNGTVAQRSIRSDLNKIALANYDSIFKRFRFIDDVESLVFTFETAIEKSFLEPDHNGLYVRLFSDLLRSQSAEAREASFGVFRAHVPTRESLVAEALRPRADPATDYIAFCESAKAKRRIVGRCQTFSGLLGIRAVSDHLEMTPLDLYARHESAMRDICGGEFDASALDVEAGTEVMLESIGVVVRRHKDLRPVFQSSIGALGTLSNRCRFKVMDILGS